MADKIGVVKLREGMILEEEGYNIRVNDKTAHAAGSDLLDLP